ncbi:phosphate/phosphite/phosphonate ABC transporter substrate-binding protein [Moraxella bovis]|uniref:phosphate/phosphite/phosphonate ABC transporter substrate-binding protein n=1 Tax=Moraxella bovis TaxID=476 RepID=UPI000DC758A6|nr:phosphate/phosphite/phosphonate ABC transporter substrate-binding protein [Moraxella bovis]AWY20548.1 phosphate ABC transporter substrate-binding protein [Moraxella bovis]UYZ82247.1 phosphate/phosphite/phosphonate ABC transporter substrate-binding protein [Moraxella bovis]UYZ88410.1 phosphate/phosphite/phosphonate ABC transporter substrate-binding protein [Moraxella bovis]UYZ93829.1 phosphate/phosphite/phosphonate ABC transporter substrate-binding protein [Moraxella bovis]UZA25936.1 phospha
MAHNFLIAPDFSPERFAGWHMFNTLLQKRSGQALHLITPASHAEQENSVAKDDVKIIYANPFDAAKLIREDGYRAVARPVGKSDEMAIISSAGGNIKTLDDLKAGAKIAMADNRDVKLIGLRLLEAVDLTEDDVEFVITETYQAAAKQVVKGEADAAFFIAEIYHSLSKLTKSQLNVLIESNIATISHVILVKDGFAEADDVAKVILSLKDDADGQAVLSELGMPDGFEPMDEEGAEFMIDLMETLLD